MEICDSVSGSGDKQTAQMLEVPALFLPCYSDPSSTEAQGRQCGSEDKGKDLNMLPLSLHCYSDPNPAETLNADHSGDPNTPQELKDVPNLPPVFKTEPNPTETLEPDCSTGDQHTLQDDVPSLSLYCYTDIHQAHAQDSDYNGKEELEESVPTLSHCYGDTNPTESLGSDCDGRDQYTLQTPLKMCSVRLVDCRTVVKLNGNITPQEEQNDYFQKNFKSSTRVQKSNGFWEEAVAQSGGVGLDVAVPSSRWQKGEQFM
ncbi:hypothetical protein P4O66_004296 [Electrophorus voltai]|uniref:Uncharacterized protein n=1 Tax=Electrophorus voltai TaxID=2609070 RepID=A0AAD8ZP40_9TELE|nr:hypothetical protein P4O66_004296 [Electrophorus voltai]